MGALVLLKYASNAQLVKREQERLLQTQQNQPLVLGIAAHIKRAWDAAKQAKLPIEQQMLKNLRQRQGEYEPAKLAEIQAQGGSAIYMLITSAKCRAAESWLLDLLQPAGDKPWGLDPSPMPELPRQVNDAILTQLFMEAMAVGWQVDDQAFDERMQFLRRQAEHKLRDLAKRIAERHETKIADQLVDARWEDELKPLISDFVTHPAAVIKGPVARRKKKLVWRRTGAQWTPTVEEGITLELTRRSPFDIYPAPGMVDLQKGNLLDRYRYSRGDLTELLGMPGFSEEAIAKILDQYGERGNMEWLWGDQQRAGLENRSHERYDPEGWIDCLNYWGSLSGQMLNDWDRKRDLSGGEGFNPIAEYQCEGWVCGPYIFKLLLNPDPLGRKPYGKACYEEIPGAFWGRGLPEILYDVQDVCNASARALCNNLAISSGPQVEVDIQRLPMGETVSQMYPWKIWQVTTDLTGNNQPAIRFEQPQSNAQELLGIHTHFERVADNISMIPNYTYGDTRVGGAGRTASGLSMLMGNASKGIKRIVGNLDAGIIKPIILGFYEYNMHYDPDPTIKGDLQPVARGSIALLIKEQMQVRRAELLQATMNPLDAQILGIDGRAELLRETVKSADLPVSKIVPEKWELELRAAQMPQPWQMLAGKGAPGMPGSEMSPPGGSPNAPRELDAAGAPVAGQDMATM